jgi:hypothetical protein
VTTTPATPAVTAPAAVAATLADDAVAVAELARLLGEEAAQGSGGPEGTPPPAAAAVGALTGWLAEHLLPGHEHTEDPVRVFTPFLTPETLLAVRSVEELTTSASVTVASAGSYAEAVVAAFRDAASAVGGPGAGNAPVGAGELILELLLAYGVAAVPIRTLATGLPPEQALSLVQSARASLDAAYGRLNATPVDVRAAAYLSTPSVASIRERAARVLRRRSAGLARWGAAVSPPVRASSRPGGPSGPPSDPVLARAARLIAEAMPGATRLTREESQRLENAVERMLAWFHAQAPPMTPDAWLRSAIPGAASSGWPAALATATASAVVSVLDLIEAATGPDTEPDPEPDVRVLAGWFPTPEQLAYLRRRYGDRVANTAAQVQSWGDIDDTPSDVLIGARILVAELSVVGRATPLRGFQIQPSASTIGDRVHALIRNEYVRAHPNSLVVSDRIVFAEGLPVGTLEPVIRRPNLLPPGFRDAYTQKQLRYLGDSLRGGARSFKRTDITDLTEKTVYEVKPRDSAPQGVIQLWGYLAGYNVVAQFEDEGVTEPRLGRPPYPYFQGQHQNPHTITEGDWAPVPPSFPALAVPPTVAIVSTYEELPGLLLYDLYTSVPEEQQEARVSVMVQIIRALIALGVWPRRPWIRPPDDPPGANLPRREPPDEQEGEEEEEEDRSRRPPPSDEQHPVLGVLIQLAILVVVFLLAIEYAAMIAAALAALIAFIIFLLSLS